MKPPRLSALFLAAALAAPGVHAQGEDFANPPDAPTRAVGAEKISCSLEGVQVVRKAAGTGTRDVDIVFLLTENPPVYFHYYDSRRKAVVFDFYDTRIGESLLESVREAPITGSSVESLRVDLNQAVPGLKPDVREVTRVSLYAPQAFEYSVRQEDNVITMSYTPKDERRSAASARSNFSWQIPLAAAALGAWFLVYEIWVR